MEAESDQSSESASDSSHLQETVKSLESKIEKKIGKLRYYLEEVDELIEDKDIPELQIAAKRTDEIRDGIKSRRAKIRHWEHNAKRDQTMDERFKIKLCNVV